MSPTVLTFSFSVMSFSGRELDLKTGKLSQIFNDPSSSICCRFCQWTSLSYGQVLFGRKGAKYPEK